MSLISISGPSDGQTIDAADVNTPLNTIANEINGNLDNANIKSSAAIDASKLAASSITNTQMATSVSPVTRWDEGFFDYVASGCVWTGDAYASTRVASMASGVVYIDGKRLTVAAVTSRTFTASKDTYVDLSDNGDGTATISYTEVANNAASPALATGAIQIAVIVTGATTIASQYSINQEQIANNTADARTVGIGALGGCSVITDSLGNRICRRSPKDNMIYAHSRSAPATTGQPGASAASWNGGATHGFIAESLTNYKFTFFEPVYSGYTGTGYYKYILYLGATSWATTTKVGEISLPRTASNSGDSFVFTFNSGTYSGLTFLTIYFESSGTAGTTSINSDSGRTNHYTIEKV